MSVNLIQLLPDGKTTTPRRFDDVVGAPPWEVETRGAMVVVLRKSGGPVAVVLESHSYPMDTVVSVHYTHPSVGRSQP